MIQSKQIFLIVGCQRSGSTLLESVFNAHPDVHVVGEENGAAYKYFFDPTKLDELPQGIVSLRIPAASHLLKHAVEKFPGSRVLFTLRDPRDVVVSMSKLEVRTRPDAPKGKWIVVSGHDEIRNCLAINPDRERFEERLRDLYARVRDPADIRYGGFCWMAKYRLVPLYLRSILPTKVIRYEVLTGNPELYLRQICEFLDLTWSDHLLEHQNYNAGQWAGTNKGEAIHRKSIEAYRKNLTMDQRRELFREIGPEMESAGYVELFD